MSGRIINIKRLSVHDGPGIRTTVFLKGCSLGCRWCHNPESISPKPEIGYLAPRCLNCGRCAEVCPNQAHAMQDGRHVFERERCIACGKCSDTCLGEALEFYGRETEATEVVAAVLEDRTFYQQSGGGCTVSGGEPLLQASFCAELFKRLKEEGVHCAVDTSGAVSWQAFETVLPHTDLFLYDLKHIDAACHQEQVGADNGPILDNLRRLAECDVPIEIRIPLIPGFNEDDESLKEIGKQLAGLKNITAVRPLPYHRAHSKYVTVGHRDSMPEAEAPSAARLEQVAEQLQSFGLTVRTA